MGHTGEFFKRRDEWRKHPMLSNQLRNSVPGLGIGIAAFAVYLVAEFAYNKMHSPSPQSHSHAQSSSH